MRRRVILAALSALEAVALASHNRRAVLSLPLAAAPVVPLAAEPAAAARPRRVLVAGASGRSGRECVRALDGDERVYVSAATSTTYYTVRHTCNG